MIEFRGFYFDGRISKARPVLVSFDGKNLHLQSLDWSLDVPLEACVITPPIGKGRRSLKLPDQGLCETDDWEAVQTLERYQGTKRGLRLVHRLESRWKTVAGCFLALVLGLWSFAVYGLPVLADRVARSIPMGVAEKISRETLNLLDGRFLLPSKLPSQRAAEVRRLFQQVQKEADPAFSFRLEFRKSRGLGANAFALPSGLIVVTDELVELAREDQELLGILVHEAAHVQRRHGFRNVLQTYGAFLLLSALMGDLASVSSTAASLSTLLIESGYSRKFEREADEQAGLYLIRRGGSTKPFQDILLRISRDRPESPHGSLFSTHPETNERVKYLQGLEQSRPGAAGT